MLNFRAMRSVAGYFGPAIWVFSTSGFHRFFATKPAVEGLLAQGQQGADVGDRLRVKLIRTDVQRGYIDFARD